MKRSLVRFLVGNPSAGALLVGGVGVAVLGSLSLASGQFAIAKIGVHLDGVASYIASIAEIVVGAGAVYMVLHLWKKDRS